jgi:hypothetical protein
MNFLKTSAFLLGFAVLGLACGDSGNDTPDAPIIGGNGGAGGSRADAYVAPGTGGAPGPIDATIDFGAGGSTGTIDGGIDGGSVASPFEINKAIINAATTSVGLTVTGPVAVPYTSCK